MKKASLVAFLFCFLGIKVQGQPLDCEILIKALNDSARLHLLAGILSDEEHTKNAVNIFLSLLDKNHFFLLEQDLKTLLGGVSEPSPEVIRQLVGFKEENLLSPVFEELVRRTQSGALELHKLWRTLPQKRMRMIDLAKRLESDPASQPPESSWPRSPQEKLNNLIGAGARMILSNVNDGYSWNEAFVLVVREIERIFRATSSPGENTSSSLMIDAYMNALDPHSMFEIGKMNEERSRLFSDSVSGIGVTVKSDVIGKKIVKLLPDGPAEQAGLRPGDVITRMDGLEFVKKDLLEFVDYLSKEPPGVSIKVSVRRDGRTMDFMVPRARVIPASFSVTREVRTTKHGRVAVIQLSMFNNVFDSVRQVLEELKNETGPSRIKGLVIDLRDNGGGRTIDALNVSELFIGRGSAIRQIHNNRIDEFEFNLGEKIWSAPVVVIVDEETASAAELTALLLQDYHRAIVIGPEQTFGKGVGQKAVYNFPQLGKIRATTHIVFTASGKTPQWNGVRPDIVLPSALVNPRFEKDLPYAIRVKKNLPNLLSKTAQGLGRWNELIANLNRRSVQRRQTDPAWNQIQKKPERDLYLEEALSVIEDVLED